MGNHYGGEEGEWKQTGRHLCKQGAARCQEKEKGVGAKSRHEQAARADGRKGDHQGDGQGATIRPLAREGSQRAPSEKEKGVGAKSRHEQTARAKGGRSEERRECQGATVRRTV